MKTVPCLVALAVAVLPARLSDAADAAKWPQFRGAESDGLGEWDTLPDRWSTTGNVVWKTSVPGWGWSSPVIQGDQIFVPSAVGETEPPKPIVGSDPGGHISQEDIHRWMVPCLERETGRIIWEREAHKGVPPQEWHPKNAFATQAPIADGGRVCLISDAEEMSFLVAFDRRTGNEIWPVDCGGKSNWSKPAIARGSLFIRTCSAPNWLQATKGGK